MTLLDFLGSWLPVVGFFALALGAVTAFVAEGPRPEQAMARAMNVALMMLVISLITLVKVSVDGPWTLAVGSALWSPLALRFDVLSSLMLTLVSLIGAVSVRFSLSYLDGDARQGDFVARVLATLMAVAVLVSAGSFMMLWLAWVAMSLALSSLLLFHGDRQQARAAAKKKFWISRLSDAALGLGLGLLAYSAGTSDIAEVAAMAGAGAFEKADMVLPAMLLIAVAAMLQSVQLPSHSWLTEVMETPTPVSALLHAGVVNAGGYLLLRFADVLLLVPEAMMLLVIVGAMTALMGSLIMLFQPSIKVSLAWSTIAQMGFMVLQVGLGAFAAAALHIAAHSFYKAHAFLASGSVVDTARLMALAGDTPKRGPVVRALLLLVVGLLYGLTFAALMPVGPFLLGLVAVVGVAQFILDESGATPDRMLFVKLVLTALGGSLAYVLLHAGTAQVLATAVPATGLGPLSLVGEILLACLFLGLAMWRGWLMRAPHGGALEAWRIHLANGLYVGLITDRMVGRYRRARKGVNP